MSFTKGKKKRNETRKQQQQQQIGIEQQCTFRLETPLCVRTRSSRLPAAEQKHENLSVNLATAQNATHSTALYYDKLQLNNNRFCCTGIVFVFAISFFCFAFFFLVLQKGACNV